MNLHSLSDAELLERTRGLAAREQSLTLEVIDHLQEIARRRLFARLGYGSPFEYAVKALGYSEPAAAQRIAAMRLARDVPEARQAMERGGLALTSAAAVQRFIQREERQTGTRVPAEKKAEIISECAGKPSREVERVLAEKASTPMAAKAERARPLGQGYTEIHLTADDELMRLIERAREVRGGGMAEVMKWALAVALERHDPLKKAERAETRANRAAAARPAAERAKTGDASPTPAPKGTEILRTPRTRHVPAAVRNSVVARAEGRCEWVDPASGRRCESRHRLELDHLTPFARGGEHRVDGIRAICSQHNRLAAIESFGPEVMGRYLRRDSS